MVGSMTLGSAVWRKSSFSSTGNCVEVAMIGDRVAVRDSKDRSGPVLTFERGAWTALLEALRADLE